MAQLLRRMFTLPSGQEPVKKPRHQRNMTIAKKVGAACMPRYHSESKVEWEMFPDTPVVVGAGQDHGLPPRWFGTAASYMAVDSPCEPPKAPTFADLRLPFEIWAEVFNYLYDGYDIHALARVCKGIQGAAKEAIQRHTVLAKRYSVAELNTYDSICNLRRLLAQTPHVALVVRQLIIRCEVRWDISIPDALATTVNELPNIRSLSLNIANDEMVASYFRVGLFSIQLPHLHTFSTTLASNPDILHFIQRHPKIQDFSLPNQDLELGARAGVNELRWEHVLPALRTLACGLSTLPRFGCCSRLTHLHVLLHVSQTLETVASLFGVQLVSLRLGVLERFPDFHSPRVVWSTQDILTRFPRLTYIQVHLFEPDMLPYPIQWQQKRDRRFKLDKRSPLTVAWVLEEDAWGTLLDPRDPDIVSQLFDEVAFDVLRFWTPYIERIVYGDSGTPDNSVYLSTLGNSVVHVADESLGEHYWKQI